MSTPYVWIIEMQEGCKWSPVVGIGLTRTDACRDLRQWKADCPDDKFRVSKYQRAPLKREENV